MGSARCNSACVPYHPAYTSGAYFYVPTNSNRAKAELQEAPRDEGKLRYQNANTEARILAERWQQYMRRRGEQSLENAREAIDAACVDIVDEGKAINLREMRARVPQQVLGSVRGVISLLRGAKERIESN